MATGPTNAGALPVSQNQTVPESPTTHKVIFIDPFGVVNEQWVENGTNAIVPTPRVHEYLTFVEWNQSTENVTEDMVVGAIYDTTDGKTYAFVKLTQVSGKNLILYLNKSNSATLTVDWGDGSISTFTNTGNFNTGAHQYTDYGDYVIKIWITGTGTYKLGNGYNSSFVGGSEQSTRDVLFKILIGDKITNLQGWTFYYNQSLNIVSLNSKITTMVGYEFYCNYKLQLLIFPKSLVVVQSYCCFRCYCLKYCSLSDNTTEIGSSAFETNYLLTLISSTKKVTKIQAQAFYFCYKLKSPKTNALLNYIPSSYATNCYSFEEVIVNQNIPIIGSSAFTNCYNVRIYKLYRSTIVTLENYNAFSGINSQCKIYVPDTLVSTYKTATNWVTYANYIYPLSDIGE